MIRANLGSDLVGWAPHNLKLSSHPSFGSFSREWFKKRDTKPAMIDTVCLGLLCFFLFPRPASLLRWSPPHFDLTSFTHFFTQEPFNLFSSSLDLCIFFCKTDIFYRVAGFVNRGGTSVANKTVKYGWKLAFCSIRSKVYPGFPTFSLFRRLATANATSILRFLNPLKSSRREGNLKIKRARAHE